MSGMRTERGGDADAGGFEGDDAPEFGRRATVKAWVESAVRATQRRKGLVAAILVLGFAALGAYYAAQTPLYRVHTTLLAQRQQAVPSIVRASVPNDLPTRAASEIVHRRENLIALLKSAGVYQAPKAPAETGWLGGLRLGIARWLNPSAAAEDPLNLLVMRLNKALTVETGDGTITISVDWPEPQQAYVLVETAMQNFLEARQLQEITAIDDAIALLQGRVSTLRQELDEALAASGGSRAPPPAADAPSRAPASRAAPADGESLAALKSNLDAKERAVRDVEEFRRRRLIDLQAQLEERRGVYAEAHPSVVALRKEIESLSAESPQIATLREEEQKLREQYDARYAAEMQAGGGRARAAARAAAALPVAGAGPVAESERVRDARFRYQQMVERLNGAQLDLDSARAAFKYRYSVVWPAEVPHTPVSPSPFKVFGLGGLALLLLAPAVALWLDRRSGLILTRGQLEVGLGVPVLAEFDREA